MATIVGKHWFASCREGLDLFKDKDTLVLISNLLSLVPDFVQAPVREVIRKAVRFSIYNYERINFSEVGNVWAHLISRWTVSTPTICRPVHLQPFSSDFCEQFQWPPTSAIIEEQDKHPKLNYLNTIGGLLKTPTSLI